MVTSFLIASIGDYICQRIEYRKIDKLKEITLD